MESTQPLTQAIANNLIWCQTVAQLHQVKAVQRLDYWQANEAMPTFFPNLVTLVPQLTSEMLVADLPKEGTYFIKDSFARLELEDARCIKLFEAKWYCATTLSNQLKPDSQVNIKSVNDADSLKQWEQLWRGEESFEPVYPCVFLDNDTIGFLLAEDHDKQAGVTYFFDGQSVGIYNLWGDKTLFTDLLNHIHQLFPKQLIVGYGDQDEIEQLQPLGFEPLAPLAVWGRFD